MRIIFLILIYFPSIFCYSQEHTPRCHFDSVYAQELKSVTYQDFLIREEHAFQEYLNNKNQYRHTQYTIPVVVHIVKNDIHSDMNITDEDIYRQIEILNETYNQLNDDLNQTPEEFQEFIGNPQIEFCLATVDPNGYATSGITRNSTEITSFSTFSDNIKHADLGGVDAWDTDFYLNIWVGKITSSVLGYSHLPNASNVSADEHGLVIGYPYFGESQDDKYDMGKTAVHEIGHYFNLKHPWGSGNCDVNNDYVDDTPLSYGPYYENPSHPQTSCESVDMFMNFMDYVNDSSMVMFTEGQVDRMHFAIMYYRFSLLQSNGCGIPSLIAEPSIIHTSSEFASDGALDLNIVSGIPPYVILWQDGNTNESIDGLSIGDYSVQIIDSLGQELNLDFSISYYGSIYDSDNFESYSVDSLLYLQSDKWRGYCEDSFAANISTISPIEGTQYLEINSSDGQNSFYLDLGSMSQNAFDVSFKIYVPNAKSAAYTILHDDSCLNAISAYEIQFHENGQGLIKYGGQYSSFSFPQSQWMTVHQLIDMDRNLVEFSIGDDLIDSWNFDFTIDHENGNNVLGSIMFDDQVDSMTLVHYFIDDFKMVLAQNSDLSLEQVIPNMDLVIYPNPAQNIINLELNQELQEICKVTIFNTLGQVLDVKEWNVESDNHLSISVDEYLNGIYFLRIHTNKFSKTSKFIIQD